MKKMRKGFTLIELLIVISILGALSASMAGSMGNSTATAKAATIAANIDTCRTAAKIYYAENFNDNTKLDVTAEAFLAPTTGTKYVPNWADFTKEGKNIIFAVDTTGDGAGKGADNWAITVNFSGAPDATAIATALSNIPGFSAVQSSTTKIKVVLLTGEITAAS